MKWERHENFGLLLHDAARLLRKRLEARGQELGLSSAQWRLLVRLLREGESTQTRLAELMEVEPISVSRLIDRMAEAGWVARRKHPTDRRVNLIVPTERALGALDQIRAMAADVYETALAGLDRHERQALIHALRIVGDNLAVNDVSAEQTSPANEGEE